MPSRWTPGYSCPVTLHLVGPQSWTEVPALLCYYGADPFAVPHCALALFGVHDHVNPARSAGSVSLTVTVPEVARVPPEGWAAALAGLPGMGPARLRAVGRLGGAGGYATTRDRFEIPRMSMAEWEARRAGQASGGEAP